MNVQISGHHVEVTEALRSYVMTKLARVSRHFDHVIDVNVVLSVEKLRQKVEANLHVSGRDIHAESEGENLYAAIDELADRLDRQVLKHKERLHVHREHGYDRKRDARS
ncbi:MAG: ribosome-associated translation inhibitor RaiA [Casimicrobiaceae bacterium]|nr:ribosome-associated translation inhibitor RaiA [Casimicrobiaceae bacterium]MCX8097463.1 ribosome-associated translation inhibitor RaiA [Casimicrobiaceae bacterium]MDW8311181.1 ribosome-associated translation inhibitor RaiA [Burkholderiales bacterium]